MTTRPAAILVRHIRRMATVQGQRSDRELLERFAHQRDEAAFAALLHRHGPMVLRVGRRVLQNGHDAEDVFQATFLVLARKAASGRWHESVANWLYGVAYHLAMKAKAAAARRRFHESRAADRAHAEPLAEISFREAVALLDEELARLPERLRAPLILCYLEGQTRDEAAQQLGWPLGTLKQRLERGRGLLRSRLARRGVTLSGALLAGALSESASMAAVPAKMAAATTQAALQWIAGNAVSGAVSGNVAALVDAASKSLSLIKLKTAALLLVGLCVLGAGAGVVAQRGSTTEPPEAQRAEKSTSVANKEEPKSAEARRPRLDRYGDPLPERAIARLGTVRFNHGDGLDALHFTPDGKTIVSTGGGLLRLWDGATGKELGQIPATRSSWDDATVVSSDGKTVICLGQEFAGDTLRVWDLAQRKEVRSAQLPVRRNELSVFRRNALSPDGRLAVVHTPSDVLVFDIETAKELCKLPLTSKDVQAAIFAGNDRVVTAFKKQTIEVWEARTGKSIRQFAHGAPVEILAASPDGRRLATLEHHISAHGFLDKDVVHLWDLTAGTEKHQLAARSNRWYQNLQFSPDGKLLLTRSVGSDRGELTVWDAETGQRLRELDGGIGQFLAFGPDGTRLADGSAWGKFSLYDLKTGRRLSPEDSQLEGAAVSLSSQGERALTIGYASISTWDTTTGRRLRSLKLPGRWFTDPRRMHSPDGRYALSFTQEGDESQIVVWDVAAGKRLHTVRLPGKAVQVASAFSPNSSLLATWHPEKEAVVRLWDVRTGKEVRSFKDTKAGWPGHLFFTPGGKTLIVTGRHTVGYDVASGKELFSWRMKPLPAQGGTVAVGGAPPTEDERIAWRTLVVSPDGTLAACVLHGGGAFDRERLTDRILLCDARTGRVIRRWSDSGKPSNGYEELAFSADGRLLATSDGNVIHLWDVLSGEELSTFRGHRGEIRSLAFSANGRRLASSSNDSTVVIWDLVPARDAKAKGVAGWWDDLAAQDARRAYAAVWRLAESADEAVPFLRRQLRAVPEPDAKHVRRLIDDLDSNDFTVREKASAELAKLGELAAPALRAALAAKPALEVRRRVEKLLEAQAAPISAPEQIRDLRAVGALEHIGSRHAQALLHDLSQGAPGARLTQEAKAALARLTTR